MANQTTNQEKFLKDVKNLNIRQQMIVDYMIAAQNNKEKVRPSQERICHDLGINRRTFNRDMLIIESLGILEREQTPYGNTTIYHLSSYLLNTAIRKILSPIFKSLKHAPFAVLSLALLLSFNPSLCEVKTRDVTLLESCNVVINKSLLSYCKIYPALERFAPEELAALHQWPNELVLEIIEQIKKSKIKPNNLFKYIMGACYRRAGCFDIEPDTMKAKLIGASNLLRKSPASHIETPIRKTPKKGHIKTKYVDRGYNLCKLGKHWTKNMQVRFGHSPVVPEKPVKMISQVTAADKAEIYINSEQGKSDRKLWGDEVFYGCIVKGMLNARDVIKEKP